MHIVLYLGKSSTSSDEKFSSNLMARSRHSENRKPLHTSHNSNIHLSIQNTDIVLSENVKADGNANSVLVENAVVDGNKTKSPKRESTVRKSGKITNPLKTPITSTKNCRNRRTPILRTTPSIVDFLVKTPRQLDTPRNTLANTAPAKTENIPSTSPRKIRIGRSFKKVNGTLGWTLTHTRGSKLKSLRNSEANVDDKGRLSRKNNDEVFINSAGTKRKSCKMELFGKSFKRARKSSEVDRLVKTPAVNDIRKDRIPRMTRRSGWKSNEKAATVSQNSLDRDDSIVSQTKQDTINCTDKENIKSINKLSLTSSKKMKLLQKSPDKTKSIKKLSTKTVETSSVLRKTSPVVSNTNGINVDNSLLVAIASEPVQKRSRGWPKGKPRKKTIPIVENTLIKTVCSNFILFIFNT